MQAENRQFPPAVVTQTGGTSAAAPTTSAPIFMDSHGTQDNVDSSGNRVVVVSGDSGAGCYVEFTVSSNVDPTTGAGAAWATLMRYDQLDIVNGEVTFGTGAHDKAFSAVMTGPIRAVRLKSWSGKVTIEVAS